MTETEKSIAVEKLSEDELTERKAKRFLALQRLRPEKKEEQVLLKTVQKQLTGLMMAEDVLVVLKGIGVKERHKEKFQAVLTGQRKAVTEFTGVFNELKMQVEFGAEAVKAVFHGAEDYEDLTPEQALRFKEIAKSREREKEQQRQQQFKMEQRQFWQGGRGGGGRQAPYFYGGRQQHYGGGTAGLYGGQHMAGMPPMTFLQGTRQSTMEQQGMMPEAGDGAGDEY